MADQRSPSSGQDKSATQAKAKQQADNARVTAAKQQKATLNKDEEKRKAYQEKLKRDQFLARLEQRRKSRDINRGR